MLIAKLALPVCYMITVEGEVINLNHMCGYWRNKPAVTTEFKGSSSPAAPAASDRRETLSRLANDYNRAFCANIGDGVSAASFFAAQETDANDLKQMQAFGISSLDLVKAASESREC